MKTQTELLTSLEEYFLYFPDEINYNIPFMDFVKAFKGNDLYDRKNYSGHITAGGFIIDPKTGKILLLKHVQLDKWLQPGGHVDQEDESVLAAALREIREETGIAASELELMTYRKTDMKIFDIDFHDIPVSYAKKEELHIHFDIRFLFALKHPAPDIIIDMNESTGFKWLLPADLPHHFGFERLKNKFEKFL